MCDICLQNSEPEVKGKEYSSTSKTIRNFWSQICFIFYSFCAEISFGHAVSTGIEKETDSVCGILTHTVNCVSTITQYTNLDLLSWSVFSYKTIGSTEVIKSCRTYSCKTCVMAFRGNEGSPITAKRNFFFFRAATYSFVISLENIFFSASMQLRRSNNKWDISETNLQRNFSWTLFWKKQLF